MLVGALLERTTETFPNFRIKGTLHNWRMIKLGEVMGSRINMELFHAEKHIHLSGLDLGM